jgi:hypothetical protein
MVSPVEIAFCLSLVKRGVETVARTRELISVSRSEEETLRQFLEPIEVARALAARRAFLSAFNREIETLERSRNTERRRPRRNVRKCPHPAAKAHSVSLSV